MTKVIDLSSDTATKPSEGMRRAMADAEVGDEQKHEDPTTSKLQNAVATLLGKEDAMFLPSATMANAIALKVHLKPGDELIAERMAHITVWEGGGYAALAGAALNPIATENGVMTGEQIQSAVRPDDPHYPKSALVCVENTHNAGGGTVWTQKELDDATQAARQNNLALHLDGARLMNAAIASNRSASEIAAPFDSVTLCLSKGLGCPIGAILAGTHEFIKNAWRPKHLLGGALRQSGILAAAGLYALEHNLPKLAQDHKNARRLAEGLAQIPRVVVDVSRVQSNLVFFRVDGLTAGDARQKIAEHGVRFSGSADRLRAVTHLDISPDDIERALDAARAAWK